MPLTKIERIMLRILDVEQPIWNDHCGHGPHTYVASFESPYKNADNQLVVEAIDMYVWRSNKICLRYGDEGSHYYSPGSVAQVLQQQQGMESYAAAAKILLALGRIAWIPNED